MACIQYPPARGLRRMPAKTTPRLCWQVAEKRLTMKWSTAALGCCWMVASRCWMPQARQLRAYVPHALPFFDASVAMSGEQAGLRDGTLCNASTVGEGMRAGCVFQSETISDQVPKRSPN